MQRAPRISYDQLIAFNDEIRALARAGIPLEQGLRAASADMPRRLGALAQQLAEQLEQGTPLGELMQRHRDAFPPAYRAVVEAGVGSGRLPAALEQLAECLRRIRDLRETVSKSMIYPTLVALAAYGLFVASLFYWAPHMVEAYRSLLGESPIFAGAIEWLRARVSIWGPLLPLLALMIFAVARRWTHRPLFAWRGFPMRRLARLRRDGHLAVFLELLVLLIRYGRPLPESVVLAGSASGSPPLERESVQLAGALRAGQRNVELKHYRELPPLLAWRLASARRGGPLEVSLERMAHTYRRRAERRARELAFYYPLIASVCIGGLAVVLYGLWIFAPWAYLMFRLTAPV